MAGLPLYCLMLLLLLPYGHYVHAREVTMPLVISTWGFVDAVREAALVLKEGGSAVDAVVYGCSTCERLRCDGSVGYGGSPDESGETTLDAMIMDGTTMNAGAVGALRSVKGAIQAAKLVMEHTEHTLLVGSQASAFALSLGLPGPTNLSTDDSLQAWTGWQEGGCQPNFWHNVSPDSTSYCGPYRMSAISRKESDSDSAIDGLNRELHQPSFARSIGYGNHDTISMAVIDKAVESMRQGMSPLEAAQDAIARIQRKFPAFIGAVFAVNKEGVHAGACYGWVFTYSVQDAKMENPEVFTVQPLKKAIRKQKMTACIL